MGVYRVAYTLFLGVTTMSATKGTKNGILLMLVCSFLWSIAGIFIKIIPWHPLVIAGLRSTIAGLVVIGFMRYRRLNFIFNKQTVLAGALMGVTMLSFVFANKLTTAANAIVLQFTAPVFILIISALFLHERFCKADIIAVILTLGGISLFFLDQLTPGNLLGNILAVVAGLGMAGMFITTARGENESARMSAILLGHGFTALVGLPMLLVFPIQEFAWLPVVSILVLGVVQLGIPYILYGLALGQCPPLMCSLLSAVEPMLNPVWVLIFDGEAPGMWALVGGVVVIATITIWCIYKGKRAPKIRDAETT